MMRRLIDVVFALFMLVLTSPLMFLVALLIKVDSTGSVLYAPQMIGKNGRLFRLLRFRTMEVAQGAVNSEQRLTRVGSFIRNYSLDHLPMLLNLLKGDLTIIGPRPMEYEAVDLHDPGWQQYFRAKPGMFNYAVLKLGKRWTSVRASHPTLNQELELEYLQQRSSISDLQLFWDAIRAYIVSRGNIKARGKPDGALEQRLDRNRDISKEEHA